MTLTPPQVNTISHCLKCVPFLSDHDFMFKKIFLDDDDDPGCCVTKIQCTVYNNPKKQIISWNTNLKK